MMEILLPLLGFLIGTVASMVGVGGGVFIVPLLTLLYEFSPSEAVGTSLATIIFTSLASTANYSRQKRIYYKTGLILALTTIPGAFLGAYLTSIIEERLLGLIFGLFIFFVALRMIFKLSFSRTKQSHTEKSAHSESSLFESRREISLGVALSFFGGLSSGLLGIGGGSLLVPIMVLAMKIPMHITVATSMFTMIFTSTSGVVQHFRQGNISFDYVLLLVLGTIFGAQLGAYTSKKISGGNLRTIFGIMLVIVSIRMILKYV
jgi:uncharacterized membrane protein YfcA